MRSRECINLKGKLEHEIKAMRKMKVREMSMEEEVEWVERNSPRLRWEYCSFHCPVQQRCKYHNRYE